MQKAFSKENTVKLSPGEETEVNEHHINMPLS